MHIKKCITIHLLLGNIRPRIRYRKMQVLWTSTRTLPWNCWGLVAPASTQMYCAMTDGLCMLCLRHDTRPRPKDKRSMTGGAISRAASPAASLPPRHWGPLFKSVSNKRLGSKLRLLFKSFPEPLLKSGMGPSARYVNHQEIINRVPEQMLLQHKIGVVQKEAIIRIGLK